MNYDDLYNDNITDNLREMIHYEITETCRNDGQNIEQILDFINRKQYAIEQIIYIIIKACEEGEFAIEYLRRPHVDLIYEFVWDNLNLE